MKRVYEGECMKNSVEEECMFFKKYTYSLKYLQAYPKKVDTFMYCNINNILIVFIKVQST